MAHPPVQTYRVERPAKRQRLWIKPVLFTIGGIVLLLIGVGIGVVGQQSTINSYKTQVAQLQGQVSTAKANVAAEQGKVTTAQQTAQNAVAAANAKAAAQYASREAAVQKLLHKLQAEQGTVQKSTISADGVYVVGKDIPSGTYHTSGAPGGGQAGGQCYFATLGSTDTSNILDNNNFNGPETVGVSGAYAFQISGGCTWHKVG
jgi:carboxypeptidase C (cathepsin A)